MNTCDGRRATSGYEPFTHADPAALQRALRPADVLLVAGNRKLSTAIKYLTQSTWSHAALYIGDALGTPAGGEEPKRLIEVEVAALSVRLAIASVLAAMDFG